jgi:hemoglobin-like flavoprotein
MACPDNLMARSSLGCIHSHPVAAAWTKAYTILATVMKDTATA